MSSHETRINSAGRPLSPGAVAVMLMLCLSWGFNQIAVKLALPDIPPMLQATIRSAGALPVLLLIARMRRDDFQTRRHAARRPVCRRAVRHRIRLDLSRPVVHLGVARGGVYLYCAVFVAFGSICFSANGCAPRNGAVLHCASGRRAGDRRSQANVDANVLLGDLMIVGGGALWAATTLIAKGTRLRFAAPEKALGYQVAMSIPILGLAAWLSGETLTRIPGPLALSLMAYQAIWVVGLTYLLWVALVKTYSASKLSAFTFITPLFGVVASYFIMHDALTLAFGAAALLVIAGLYLVNRPSPVGPVGIDPLLNVTKT
jgi:drug/metabolite transporter (DMT)-like permease